MDTLIKGAASQVLAIRAEGHTVDGFLVLGQRVNTNPSLDIPQSHCRVERGAACVGGETGRMHRSDMIKYDMYDSIVHHFQGFMKQWTELQKLTIIINASLEFTDCHRVFLFGI